jgi:hypothetical protein
MAFQLPVECLNEILEYLEGDKLTLYSCLLVNRLWCKIAIRILWRNILDFKSYYQQCSLRVASSIISTLIACLPNESKEFLYRNEMIIPTPTLNPPLFNYAKFCKVLSINEMITMIDNVLKDSNSLIANEIIKMFTNEISSLKKFTYCYSSYYHFNIYLPYIPGASDLSELTCTSNLPSELFYQLSQISHNLQSISISFDDDVSNGLKELISSQNNLKNLTLSAYDGSWESIIPAITKHSQTITKLQLYGDNNNLPFSFVSSFLNLQEFIFSFFGGVDFKDFKILQYINFSKLEVLKFPYQCPKPKYVMKFLENNGKNLRKFYSDENDKDLSLSIAKFCPKITSLFVIFNKGEIDILKDIFINCQYLESITIWCGYSYLTEKEVLDTVLNYSPNNFHELKLYSSFNLDVTPGDLESFFISWNNITPKKLLNLIFIEVFVNEENLKILEKYEDLGIIKFWAKQYEEEEKEEELDYYY